MASTAGLLGSQWYLGEPLRKELGGVMTVFTLSLRLRSNFHCRYLRSSPTPTCPHSPLCPPSLLRVAPSPAQHHQLLLLCLDPWHWEGHLGDDRTHASALVELEDWGSGLPPPEDL